MLLSKTLRAAALAVAGVFLLSALPAAAAPVRPSAKPLGIERSQGVELTATATKNTTKKKPKKKIAKKKAPAKKQTA